MLTKTVVGASGEAQPVQLDCKTAFCSVLFKVVYCSVEMSLICAAKYYSGNNYMHVHLVNPIPHMDT